MTLRLVEDVARVFQRHVSDRVIPRIGQAYVTVSRIRRGKNGYIFSARMRRPSWILSPLPENVERDMQRAFSSYRRRQHVAREPSAPSFSMHSDAAGRYVAVRVESTNLRHLVLYNALLRLDLAVHAPRG